MDGLHPDLNPGHSSDSASTFSSSSLNTSFSSLKNKKRRSNPAVVLSKDKTFTYSTYVFATPQPIKKQPRRKHRRGASGIIGRSMPSNVNATIDSLSSSNSDRLSVASATPLNTAMSPTGSVSTQASVDVIHATEPDDLHRILRTLAIDRQMSASSSSSQFQRSRSVDAGQPNAPPTQVIALDRSKTGSD